MLRDVSGIPCHHFGFSGEGGPYDRGQASWKNITSGLSGVIARMIASASTAWTWSRRVSAPKRQLMFHCGGTWVRRVRKHRACVHKTTTAAKNEELPPERFSTACFAGALQRRVDQPGISRFRARAAHHRQVDAHPAHNKCQLLLRGLQFNCGI